MKCSECGKHYPARTFIGGKAYSLKCRTRCLDCSPFKRKRPTSSRPDRVSARAYYRWFKARNGGNNPTTTRRKKYKQFILNKIGGKCQLCGYKKCIRGLVFHHVKNKRFDLSGRSMCYTLDTILSEVSKCILVCHNCHSEIHDNVVSLKRILQLNKKIIRSLKPLAGKSWKDVT